MIDWVLRLLVLPLILLALPMVGILAVIERSGKRAAAAVHWWGRTFDRLFIGDPA